MDRGFDEYKMKLNQLSGKSVYENLVDFIEINIQTFDKAVKENVLYPYTDFSHSLVKMLIGLREDTRKMVHTFKYARDERSLSLVEVLNKRIPLVEERAFCFDYMKNSLMKHIQLEILPNDLFDGERVYLANGYVVMPTGLNPKTYRVIKVSPLKRPKGNETLDFKLLDTSSSSVNDAIKNHVDQDIIATVAVAKNTGHYPLFETALPIVKEKYLKGLESQDS